MERQETYCVNHDEQGLTHEQLDGFLSPDLHGRGTELNSYAGPSARISTTQRSAPEVSLEVERDPIFPDTDQFLSPAAFDADEVMTGSNAGFDGLPGLGGGDLDSEALDFSAAPSYALQQAYTGVPAAAAQPTQATRKRGQAAPAQPARKKRTPLSGGAHGVLDLQASPQCPPGVPRSSGSQRAGSSAHTRLAPPAAHGHSTRNQSLLAKAGGYRLSHDASGPALVAVTPSLPPGGGLPPSAAPAPGAPLGHVTQSMSQTVMAQATPTSSRFVAAHASQGMPEHRLDDRQQTAAGRANSPSSSESGLASPASPGAGSRGLSHDDDDERYSAEGLNSPSAAGRRAEGHIDPKLVFRFEDGREHLFSVDELRNRSNKFFVVFQQVHQPTAGDIANMRRFRRRLQLRQSSKKGREEQRMRQAMLQNRLDECYESIMTTVVSVVNEYVADSAVRSTLCARLRSAVLNKISLNVSPEVAPN